MGITCDKKKMDMEIGKGNGKGFGKENDIFSTFIYENNGKYEKREVKGHRLHVRRKMKENNGKLKKLEASSITTP